MYRQGVSTHKLSAPFRANLYLAIVDAYCQLPASHRRGRGIANSRTNGVDLLRKLAEGCESDCMLRIWIRSHVM